MQYPKHLQKLIEELKRLPGVGSKSAERFAFHMLEWTPEQLAAMGRTIQQTPERLHCCDVCGCLQDDDGCSFCDPKKRQCRMLCVISSPRDAFAIDSSNSYRGLYHVLGGLLSPIDGRGPEVLHLDRLTRRLETQEIEEVVIALDATLDGDATAHYIRDSLGELPQLRISRLAFGLPMGSSIDYVDGDTLSRAFSGRQIYSN